MIVSVLKNKNCKDKMESYANASKYCFWDKHPFEGNGVRCPIFYKPKQLIKTKREYVINENVSEADSQDDYPSVREIKKKEIVYDDMFCSDRCCLAWIEDNFQNSRYKQSKFIFYNECLKSNKPLVKKANDWRTLAAFGGWQTIKEFREDYSIFEKAAMSIENDSVKTKYIKKINM